MSKALHEKSVAYWTGRETTYLATADYYARQERELRSLLAGIGPVARIGDVGCGDGRYTLVALETAREVHGFDIGAKLIAEALKRKQAAANGENATFSIGSFEALEEQGPFDVVLCLGVISALIDDAEYDNALNRMTRALKPGGWLFTKDTLANGEGYTVEQGDYVARYRKREAYVKAITDRGLTLTDRVELIKATPETTNAIYVFRS